MRETAAELSEITDVDLMTIARLSKEQKALASTMGRDEARCLVDAYYQIQDYRKAAGNQRRAGLKLGDTEKVDLPAYPLIEWLGSHTASIELRLKNFLQAYAENDPVGQWSLSVCGIGPVISAGLLCHIDIEKAQTVGAIWKFAGLDPTSVWGKGQRRPWNAKLKTLCWHIGECFVKVQNNKDDFYGQLYVERKLYEQQRNEAGELADQAANILATKNFKSKPVKEDCEAAEEDFKRASEWYSQGMLPPAHIHARAKRWVVKLFLAHWHEVAFCERFGTMPPKPYVIEHCGHIHKIEVPNYKRIEKVT